MRRLRAFAGFCAAAFALAVIAPAAADARTEIFKLRSAPVALAGFQVKFPKVSVPTPRRSGYITRMDAWLVDEHGRRMSIREVMLHHIVFINRGKPGTVAKHSSCPGRGSEPFWGTGEEKQPMKLPLGYGYRIGAHDRWRMQTMIMSHSLTAHVVRVVYTVRMVIGATLQRVKPLWLRANGCSGQPSYDIEGDQPPGTIHSKQSMWRMPISGRIVAASGHLHGSSYGLTVKQPRCDERTLIDQKPLYGLSDDLVYSARPMLHEPGPIATGMFLSQTGIPIRKGEMLRVTGLYDASRPHARVMAITHLYVAADRAVSRRCDPLPRDAHIFWTRKDGRTNPPVIDLPLNGIGADGMVHEIPRPPGEVRILSSPAAMVQLTTERFLPANLSVARGTQVVWRFNDLEPHNVMLASGPRHIASNTLGRGSRFVKTLDTPGTYKLFCYLHPITMTQVIDVRP
jgi:plastocyanin